LQPVNDTKLAQQKIGIQTGPGYPSRNSRQYLNR